MTGSTKKGGFTLVEVLVSTAVISIVMVLVIDLLFLYFSSQNVAFATLQIDSTSRQFIASIGEDVSQSYIDYDYYPGGNPSSMNEALALRSVDGLQTVYWFWDGIPGERHLFVCPDMPQDSSCPIGSSVYPPTDPDWHQVNPDNIIFGNGNFRIYPDDAPYMVGGAPLSDDSPFVILYMTVHSNEGDIETRMQTAFSTRLYVR